MKRLWIFFAVAVVASVMGTTAVFAADQAAIRAEVVQCLAKLTEPAITPPAEGKAWMLEAQGTVNGRAGAAILRWDGKGRCVLGLNVPKVADVVAAFGERESWLYLGHKDKLFVAHHEPRQNGLLANCSLWPTVKTQLQGVAAAAAIAPLPRNLALSKADDGTITLELGGIRVSLSRDAKDALTVGFSGGELEGKLTTTKWQQVPVEELDKLLAIASTGQREEVDAVELHATLAAMTDFACEYALQRISPALVPQLFAGLPRQQGQVVVRLAGTPEEMGRQHGRQLRAEARYTMERVLFGVGLIDTVRTGEWFPAKLERVWQAQQKHIPERFVREIDAMAEAAGLPKEWARRANVFPELFHCSGMALRGKATLGGALYHGRVLDYMTQAGLQNVACVMVFQPKDHNAWGSVGYAGFCGTVTAMNANGLAMGEMGGRGEGCIDGIPMALMMREIVERFDTAADALAWMRSVPRTCEYFYVLSDAKTGQVAGVASLAAKLAKERGVDDLQVIGPGQPHPLLPRTFEDVVLMSADRRYATLADRVQNSYGKIDMQIAWDLMRWPVAMNSNLHTALFAPETLDLWVAQAGPRGEPAYTQPVAKFNLKSLLETPVPAQP